MLVFVDADVLASPMTRTILIITSLVSERFSLRWTLEAEAEADKALRPGQTQVSDLRGRYHWGENVLVPDATSTAINSLIDTSEDDKHVLAAAKLSGIRVVITRNIHDFGNNDLREAKISVVHPDLFLSNMVEEEDYRDVLEEISRGRVRPPRTPEELHSALGIGHPLLFASMRSAFPHTEAQPSVHRQPSELFRGNHCFICGKMLKNPNSLAYGVGPECSRTSL